MGDYTFEVVAAIITHKELIESFLERTTSELFPLYYELNVFDAFFNQENNTLRSPDPQTTRIPKKDTLRENLLILKVDVERALAQLSAGEKFSVVYYYQIYEGKKTTKTKAQAIEAVQKMVAILNGEQYEPPVETLA